MRRHIRDITWLAVLCGVLVTAESFGQTFPSTVAKPRFTVSKETTLIEGPLNPDGTVNYLPAIDVLISAGVTKENNAAIPILKASANFDFDRDRTNLISQALGITPPPSQTGLLQTLNFYMRDQNGGKLTPEISNQVDLWTKAMRAKPWKSADLPVVATWLKDSGKALQYMEEACKCDRFYVPMISSKSPPIFADAISLLASVRMASEMLAARAMLRAGEGDFKGSLEDMRRQRILARLLPQQHNMISHLVGNAIEREVMRGYEALATSGTLTAEQLGLLSSEITALPPLTIPDDLTNTIEEYSTLDTVMQIIRGDGGHIFRLYALEFDESKPINFGDIADVDWDVAMKEIHHVITAVNQENRAATFSQLMANSNRRVQQALAEQIPGSAMFNDKEPPVRIAAVEAFLKKRPNESREQFSRRIGRWLANDPGLDQGVILVIERTHVERSLALLAVSLAQYRLARGTYPATLQELGQTTEDTFAGKSFTYHPTANEYVLYSFGLNRTDDQGAGDDIVVKAGM